jgi:hypothetical protein
MFTTLLAAAMPSVSAAQCRPGRSRGSLRLGTFGGRHVLAVRCRYPGGWNEFAEQPAAISA